MEFGNSLGPFLDRIPDTPDAFDFVEPSLGDRDLVDLVARDLLDAGFDGSVTVESFSPDRQLVEHSRSVLQDAFPDAT